MNVERLHAIALEVLDDIQKTNTEDTLKQLVDALQNQVNQPQTPQFQQQVSQHLQTLSEALSTAPSNDFSPAWRQVLQELGIHDLLGGSLRARIQEIFERNQITPSVALDELKGIHSQFTEYKAALDKLTSAFQQMKIGAEELEPGQCEIGILVPRKAIHNKLLDFAKDLEDLDRVFGTFSELTTGKRPGFQIRSISSSDFSVFLDMWPVIAAGVAYAVERIVRTYKNILEIRKFHGELKNRGVSNKQLQGITSHANSIMKKEIEKLVKELFDKYYVVKDEGRRNELANELRIMLKKIANRIDKGYSVEVRVEPLTEEEEGAKGKPPSKDIEYIKAILSASKNLEFLKLEGEPILKLRESQGKKSNQKS